MKTLVELNAALFLISCGSLFFVLRYRIHVHITSSRKFPRATMRRAHSEPVGHPAAEPSKIELDLISALKNLGASEGEARSRASRALAQGPGDFDALILRAMQSTDGMRSNPGRRRRA